ncbi:MAG: hypothetical protein NC084_04155 [Bacteroides sp.]|nr:hypothetical protein [Eubacterium sp.]MCM1417641.1 hypothetical protein [Roseburia sp.]MCM1461894.1 hypothetical protein [Bacteroides sp.]
MTNIKEVIRNIASEKATAARNTADKVTVNNVVFAEGIQPGEVRLEKGIADVGDLMGEKVQLGYIVRESYGLIVRWFRSCGVMFYEEDYVSLDRIPEDAPRVDGRQKLYRSERTTENSQNKTQQVSLETIEERSN